MSLKAFHIFFIALSVLLSFGFSVWLLQSYAEDGKLLELTGGILAIITGGALVLYGIRFLKKLKHVGYL